MYDLRVIFIVELGPLGEMLHEHLADLFVFFFASQQADTFEDSSCVGVDHKGRAIGCIEQDGVGGLRTDPRPGEKPCSRGIQWSAAEIRQRALPLLLQVLGKVLQAECFLPKKTGWPDQLLELANREGCQLFNGEDIGVVEIPDGLLDVAPGGVLGQDSANDDFERTVSGPPVECTIVVGENLMDAKDLLFGGCTHVGGYLLSSA